MDRNIKVHDKRSFPGRNIAIESMIFIKLISSDSYLFTNISFANKALFSEGKFKSIQTSSSSSSDSDSSIFTSLASSKRKRLPEQKKCIHPSPVAPDFPNKECRCEDLEKELKNMKRMNQFLFEKNVQLQDGALVFTISNHMFKLMLIN